MFISFKYEMAILFQYTLYHNTLKMSSGYRIFFERVKIKMKEITREEATFLRSRGINVVKTCKLKRKGSKRGKFYCSEEAYIQRLLNEYRQSIATKEG